MFAAIREIYNIPRDENRKLRDYPTLAHVVRFVYEKRPDLAAPYLERARAKSPKDPSIAYQLGRGDPPAGPDDHPVGVEGIGDRSEAEALDGRGGGDPHGQVLVLQERDVDPGTRWDDACGVLHLRDILAGHFNGEVV